MNYFKDWSIKNTWILYPHMIFESISELHGISISGMQKDIHPRSINFNCIFQIFNINSTSLFSAALKNTLDALHGIHRWHWKQISYWNTCKKSQSISKPPFYLKLQYCECCNLTSFKVWLEIHFLIHKIWK